MLELKRIREDPDGVRTALARRDPALKGLIGTILEKDQLWRAATTSAESLRAMQKTQSEAYAAARARGEEAADLRARMQEMSTQVKEWVDQAAEAKHALDVLLAPLPNLPDPTAAPGPDTSLSTDLSET